MTMAVDWDIKQEAKQTIYLTRLRVYVVFQVTEYLTEQFYDRNYTIRQRLDIIEVYCHTIRAQLFKTLLA